MKELGFIVIRHPILMAITERRVEEALYKDFGKNQTLRFKHVEVPLEGGKIIEHTQIMTIPWKRQAIYQEQVYQKTISPLLEEYPDYTVVYFGTAPVSLAMHLGSKIGTWRPAIVYLKNHVGQKEWYIKNPSGSSTSIPKIKAVGIPQEEYAISGDVLVKISTSYKINRKELEVSLPSSLIKSVDISLEKLYLDLPSIKYVEKVADHFREALNRITNNLKQIDKLHIIATVPVGLAFLIGTHISANVHVDIQTYQYNKHKNPPYQPTITLGSNQDIEYLLADDDHQKIKALKQHFKTKWPTFQAFINQQKRLINTQHNWVNGVIEESQGKHSFQSSFWKELPCIFETPLQESTFATTQDVEGGFRFTDDEAWEIDNQLIYYINRKLNQDSQKTHRALRMLLFHEGMHYWCHDLSGITAPDIGRFPKVLEAADYQADVWAILHEYAYTQMYHPEEITDNPSKFFVKLIRIALATMWAFDDKGTLLKQIQIRRMNRYLIWYWQLIRLQDKRCDSMGKALSILSEIPILEIKGLRPRTEGYRIFYNLEKFETANLELGVLWRNKIYRIGNTSAFKIPNLIEGFNSRNGEKILRVLKVAYSQCANR